MNYHEWDELSLLDWPEEGKELSTDGRSLDHLRRFDV